MIMVTQNLPLLVAGDGNVMVAAAVAQLELEVIGKFGLGGGASWHSLYTHVLLGW